MSRNLADTGCRICRGDVTLTGSERLIREEDCGPHLYRIYAAILWVAEAACVTCDAKYLAWVRVHPGSSMDRGHWKRFHDSDDRLFVDLSFRSSFNDEPGADDLPTPEVLRALHEKEQLGYAADLRRQASELVQQAIEHEDRAATGTPGWEAYRSL